MGNLAPAAPSNYVLRSWQSKDGLPHERIDALAQTPEGFLWLATPAGLVRFDGRDFRLSQPFGAGATNAPASVVTDPSGVLWILSRSGEIKRQGGGRFVPVALGPSVLFLPAKGIYSDGVSLLLATDANAQVWRWEAGAFKPWLNAGATAAGEFIGINVDRSSRVWARHGSTLSWWKGTEWARLEAPAGNVNFAATKTAASQDGGVWVASREGARKFRDGRWDSVEVRFPSRVSAIQCFAEDRHGNLWLSTGNDGLWHFDLDRRFESLTQAHGLATDKVRQLLEDMDGSLWVATSGGLSLICERGAMEAGLTNSVKVSELTPTGVAVEQVSADEKPLSPKSAIDGDQFRIPRGVRQVEIQMAAIGYLAPEALQLRYRLDGVDADWQLAGHERTAIYSNLPPGQHFFRLAASYAKSTGRQREATVRFEVEPQLWQTWPFRGGLATVASLALVGGYQWRLTRLRKGRDLKLRFAQALLQSQEAERKRIAAELHDGLGQQLLVIKNNARLGLREPLSARQVRHQLELVSQTASECIEEIRTMTRHLRPYQLDQLGLTKAIHALVGQVAQASGIKMQADLDVLDGLLPAEAEIHLYRIVQESLNNVARHAAATEASVHVDHIGPQITMRIADNGRGFATEPKPGVSGGFGLTNISERAALLGGHCELHSTPGRGVRVQVVVPLPKNSNQK